MKFHKVLISTMAIASAIYADAAPAYITKAAAKDNVEVYGTQRKETYDVAIRLDASMAGGKVLGLRVPMGATENISATKGFITTTLSTELVDGKRQNLADIATKEASLENGILSVTFDEPYTITSSGIYVGFSFTIDELDTETMKPLIGTRTVTADGFYLRTSNSQTKWIDATKDYNFTTSLAVQVDDEKYAAVDGVITTGSEYYGARNKSVNIPCNFYNKGGEALESLEYSWKLGNTSGTQTIKFSEPVVMIYGFSYPFEAVIPTKVSNGNYLLQLQITKINGKENPQAAVIASPEVNIVEYIPVYRPLVEEYTGTWCGYCTRGIAAFEYMYANFPDDFVGVAYHHGNGNWADPMQVSIKDPSTPGSLPACFVNRTSQRLDPFFGDLVSTNGLPLKDFGFLPFWENERSKFTPFDLSISAEFDKTDSSKINVTLDVTSVLDLNGTYTIGWLLAEDDINNPNPETPWLQANSNTGMEIVIPELKQFSEGTTTMANLTYNDVVLRNDGGKAVATLPKQIANCSTNTINFTVDASQIKGYTNENLIQNPENLRVIAYVANQSNIVMNSIQYRMNGKNNVSVYKVNVDSNVVETLYYDFNGMLLPANHKGLCIKVEKMSDGNMKASKVVLK